MGAEGSPPPQRASQTPVKGRIGAGFRVIMGRRTPAYTQLVNLGDNTAYRSGLPDLMEFRQLHP